MQAGQVRISTGAATLDHLAQQFWHRILAMADLDDDQQLSLEEFQSLLKVGCLAEAGYSVCALLRCAVLCCAVLCWLHIAVLHTVLTAHSAISQAGLSMLCLLDYFSKTVRWQETPSTNLTLSKTVLSRRTLLSAA